MFTNYDNLSAYILYPTETYEQVNYLILKVFALFISMNYQIVCRILFQ
jgi:hypothetical protein